MHSDTGRRTTSMKDNGTRNYARRKEIKCGTSDLEAQDLAA
jgi:hypothetical protein